MTKANNGPIRLAVFDDVSSAIETVRELRTAGFSIDEISVLCSDEHRERLFGEYEHEEPSGSNNDLALKGGGIAALGLGGAALATGLLSSAGTAIIVVGALAGMAVISSFVALMLTRGAERALADYYDQAVISGKILVAVETELPARQKQADVILQRLGTQAVSIPKEF